MLASIPQQLQRTVKSLKRVFLPYDVFLSYRWLHKEYARALSRLLTARGLRCFLDDDELGGGEDIPTSLKVAIRKTRMFVLLGTPEVPDSNWIRQELMESLEHRKKIVPVNVGQAIETFPQSDPWTSLNNISRIDECSVALSRSEPSGEVPRRIDEAFTFTRANVLARQVLTVLMSLMIAVSVLVVVLTMRSAREVKAREASDAVARQAVMNRDEAITTREVAVKARDAAVQKQWAAVTQQQLDYTQLTMEKTPTNLIRRKRFEELLKQAQEHQLSDIEANLSELIAAIPESNARLDVAEPDNARFEVTISRSGRYLITTSHQQIEMRDAGNLKLLGMLRTRDLTGRRPCRIIWSASDPSSDAAFAELEYDDLATQDGVAYRDYSSKRTWRDYEVEGNDREIIRVELPSLRWSSLGLSQRAQLHHPYDENGNLDRVMHRDIETSRDIAMQQGNRSEELLRRLPQDRHHGLPPYSAPIAALIARDRFSDAQLFEVKEWPPDMAEAGPPTVILSVALYTANREVVMIGTKSLYKPGAEPYAMSGQDTGLGEHPLHTPAAVNERLGLVLVRNKLYSVVHGRASQIGTISLDWESVENVWIANDRSIIAIKKDGEFDVWKPGELKPRHAMLAINRTIDRTMSGDAQRAYLLRSDGSIEVWKIEAFGSDGWASHAH